MSFKVIAVDVRYRKPLEGLAGGTLLPGMLLQRSGSSLVAHAVAGESGSYIADYLLEKSIADSFASGDYLPYLAIEDGDKVNMPLTTSQTISVGDKLTSNGDGYLKEAGTGLQNLGDATDYVPVTPKGNKVVRIALIDPDAKSSALAVSVDGNYIAVSLATDGSGVITSTAALVKAAIEADSDAAALVSVGDAAGTGAIEADEALLQADAVFGIAQVAVTTTSSASRVIVRKGDA